MCPKCKQSNTTLMWWQISKTNQWVCLPCGMDRREEQNKIEIKYKKDNPINDKFKNINLKL